MMLEEIDKELMTVVIDLDGTLCDDRHRSHLAAAKQWDEYHGACHADAPFKDVLFFLRCLPLSCNVLALTGRDERWRNMTTDWLKEHGASAWVDEIIMRPTGDYTPANELKLKQLETRFGSKANVLVQVLLVLENTDKIVIAMRDYGLTVWQPRAGA